MTIEEFVIKQETGENLQQVISKVLVKSKIEAVKEFVSNSYDADAENVKINVNEKKKKILIEDDGNGISEAELDDFMRMADSNKIANPISPKGRKRIGKFGIAKVLLEFLGDEYKLDTWCNKNHILGIENFRENEAKGLEYTLERTNENKTGTSLLIKGVKSLGTKQFPMRRLRHALTWTVPNQEDFKIFLNGKRLIRKNNKPKQKFYFEAMLPEAGNVNMEVQYFATPPKISGIFIYINKRAVGDSKEIKIQKLRTDFRKRLFVKINADGLQEHISFNRAYIKEDNKAYAEVKKWVCEKLGETRKAITPLKPIHNKTTIFPQIKVRMQKILGEFSPLKPLKEQEKNTDNFKAYSLSQVEKRKAPDNGVNLKPKKSKKDLFFSKTHIIDKGISSPQAKVDSKTQELLINTGHPWYNSIETANSEVLKAHMILGAAFALGWEKYIRNGGSQCKMNDFYALCAKFLSTEGYVEEVKGRVRETGMFVSFRRYDIKDVIREHMSLACLYELAASGGLEIHNNTILGSDLNNYMKKALDCTPAVDVVRTYELKRINKATGRLYSRERVRQRYSEINNILKGFKDKIPFIFDIGITKPFFLIRNEDVQKFLGLYAQGALKKGINRLQYLDKYERLFNKLKEDGEREQMFVGLESLCGINRSSPHEVFRIISYAQKKGIEIPFEEKEEGIKYSVSHFRKAREEFLIRGKNV